MKVVIDIADKDIDFGMKVLQSLSFIKKAKPFSKAGETLYADLKAAAKEVRLHKQEKIKLKTAQELLNEL